MTLRVQTAGRQFVLRPPTDRFPGLPANEHVTMRIAALCGLPVPEQQQAYTRLLNERALVLAELARRGGPMVGRSVGGHFHASGLAHTS